MNNSSKYTLAAAALILATATVLGAYAAHGLERILDANSLAAFTVAVDYQFYHGLGLLGIGLLRQHAPQSKALAVAAWLMVAGIVLFCGSLYVLQFFRGIPIGLAAPIGGLSFIAAWLTLAYGVLVSDS